LPGLGECREFLDRIRHRVTDQLPQLDLEGHDPLMRDGFVFRMVLQHEYQHNETILQTLQLKRGDPYHPPRGWTPPESPAAHAFDGMVRFPGGRVEIGTDDRSAAYDNERPRHEVDLAPFLIDAAPVTEEAYADFVEAGGYQEREYWSDQGWTWLQESGVEAPKHWRRDGEGWTVRSMDRERPLDPRRPVCHVCFHEADAYARFMEKRLPSEFEWEAAATWNPETGSKSAFPWGDEPPTRDLANIDVLSYQTAPVGSYPRNVSPIGCYGMIGDVWEWTSSDFGGYPGYETFPYPEYSEVFFGDEYKVLRGGAWATRAGAIRGTFRNWDYPIRRQIFSGLRCARDD
jgi:iron(II)-dependent oxidoreductase